MSQPQLLAMQERNLTLQKNRRRHRGWESAPQLSGTTAHTLARVAGCLQGDQLLGSEDNLMSRRQGGSCRSPRKREDPLESLRLVVDANQAPHPVFLSEFTWHSPHTHCLGAPQTKALRRHHPSVESQTPGWFPLPGSLSSFWPALPPVSAPTPLGGSLEPRGICAPRSSGPLCP